MSFSRDYEHEGGRIRVVVRPLGDDHFRIQVGERSHDVHARALADGSIRFLGATGSHVAATAPFGKSGIHLRLDGATHVVRPFAGHGHDGHGHESSNAIEAPMTGTVLSVGVAIGDRVETGATLIVLSAMKMEHKLRAGCSGTVSEIRVAAGETVDQGTMLLRIEPDE